MQIRTLVTRMAAAGLVVATTFVAYVTAAASWGEIPAVIGTALSFLVLPFLFSRVRMSEEEAWLPSAGARRWARFLALSSVLVLALLASTARVAPCDALRALPAKHAALGKLAHGLARFGDWLASRGGR